MSRPVARIDQLSYYPALMQRIRALAGEGLGNAAIADRLAIEGFRTPRLHERFHDGEIQHLIRGLGLRPGLDPVFAHGVGCEWRLGDGLTAGPFVSFSDV